MRLDISFHKPTIDDEDILKEYVQEHIEAGESTISASVGLNTMPYNDWLESINIIHEGWGRNETYLVCFNDHLIGLVNIRPYATNDIVEMYGHIGYGIRPSYRGQGFASEILKYAINRCKICGLNEVILGCVSTNIASAKTILRNGGQLIRETCSSEFKPGQQLQYYRILLTEETPSIEYWDLYNENREVVLTDHVRGTSIPDNCYHLVVHAWIKNSKGEYLISQRSAKRKTNPLKWECQGGSVLKGESSFEGVVREIKEEVGITVDPANAQLVLSRLRGVIDGKKFCDIMDVWLFHYDGQASLQDATTDEVAQVRWMTYDEIRDMYNNGMFVDTLKYFIDNHSLF